MTTRTVLSTLVTASALFATSARADDEVRPPPPERPKPAWCPADLTSIQGMRKYDPNDTVAQTDPETAVSRLVKNMCAPGDESRRIWDQLEAARARWSKYLDLTEADWVEVAEWAPSGRASLNFPNDQTQAWSRMDPVEQYSRIRSNSGDVTYFMDALGSKVTEGGRMAYIEDCLSSNKAVGDWLVCHADVLAFDAAKGAAELRGATRRTPQDRMAMRFSFAKLKPRVAKRIADMQALVDKDPAYGTMLPIGADAHKRWSALGVTPLIQLAADMDDARVMSSRKALEGCSERTWAAFQTAFGALPAKQFDGVGGRDYAVQVMSIALDDPDVYLAAHALAVCEGHSLDRVDHLIATINGRLERRHGQRGPRTETITNLLAANIVLDDPSTTIRYPSPDRNSYKGLEGGPTYNGEGVVVGVTTSDAGVRVEFKADKVQVSNCSDWKETKKIDSIDSSGHITYRGYCAKWEKSTVNNASEPLTIVPRYATAIKKGAYVHHIRGITLVVYPKKGATTPVAVFGIPLK